VIIGIIRYGKTIIIHPLLAQPKPVPCSCWSMFFWKTQQKCHVIVNKLHDIHIEIYRGIEQTYFCRFLFGKSRAITYILVQQFYYVCTFRVTDQLLFSFFHGANDKVSNSDENIRIYHDLIWNDLKNLIRKSEILTCYNTNYSLSHDIIRKAADRNNHTFSLTLYYITKW